MLFLKFYAYRQIPKKLTKKIDLGISIVFDLSGFFIRVKTYFYGLCLSEMNNYNTIYFIFSSTATTESSFSKTTYNNRK